jgi:nitrite reductase/ring-hydroxylating ferredoxin subunit
MTEFVKVASASEISDGSGKTVDVHGRKIAVFNAGGSFYAIDDACRHRGGPLGEGEVYGTRVVCPWHGWEYDFSTGCNIDDPTVKLSCFAVKVEGGDLLVEV